MRLHWGAAMLMALTGCAGRLYETLPRPMAGYEAVHVAEAVDLWNGLGSRFVVQAGTVLVADRDYHDGGQRFCGPMTDPDGAVFHGCADVKGAAMALRSGWERFPWTQLRAGQVEHTRL